MSFFEKLAHQISANGGDAPRRASWVSITRAGDIDEFRETIRGYRVQLAQIDKGPFVGEAVQSQLSGVLLTTTQFSRAVARSGDRPSGKITFAMGTSMMPAVWQGSRLGPHDLLVAAPEAEFDIVSQAGYGIAAASSNAHLAIFERRSSYDPNGIRTRFRNFVNSRDYSATLQQSAR